MSRAAALAGFVGLLLAVPPGNVQAQATLLDGFGGARDFGADCLGPNDDGSSSAVDLTPFFPGGLRFFGVTYTTIFVNTNGNVSFGAAVPRYTPRSFPAADQPVIAPYWADIDTRMRGGVCTGPGGGTGPAPACDDPTDNGIWWHGQSGMFVVTWDQVGYYDCHDDLRMSFQLVLRVPEMCASGADVDVEFRYNRCEWTTGDRSSGVGGFGGIEAQAGFDAGDSTNYVEIPGSREPNIHTRLCEQSNVGSPGVWRFRIRSGAVLCPDAGSACDTGLDGACGLGRTVCSGGSVMCVQEGVSGAEACDGIDNDCNGLVDDGATCAGMGVCDGGRCVEPCFEGGCPAGRVCSARGTCVRGDCAEVMCAAGERCQFGICIGACDGVTCPAGQRCAGGRCIDPCEGLECGTCAVCEDGLCVDRCDLVGCPSSSTCSATGSCVEVACDGVTCAAAEFCQAGTCVDACDGSRCPRGQDCVAGACVDPPPVDAGVDAGIDAGARDAGTLRSDAGFDAAVADGGAPVTPPPSGCACRVGRRSTSSPAFFGLALVALCLRFRRRLV